MSLVVAKRAIKDHWSDWDEKFVPAPVFDILAYQERLNEVCGLSRDKPIMKLEWGGNATITRYTGWDNYGKPINAEIAPRYAIPRDSILLPGLKRYIPIRRWIISELVEDEQLRPDDNTDNRYTDENGVSCIAGVKTEHKYLPYIYVGDHSKCAPDCCKERICLGDYKAPGEPELSYLLKCTYNLKKDFYCDPRSPLSGANLAKVHKEYQSEHENALERKEMALESDLEYETKSWLKTHGHTLEDANLKQPIYIYKDGKPI